MKVKPENRWFLMDKTGLVPRPITLGGYGPTVPIGGKTGA